MELRHTPRLSCETALAANQAIEFANQQAHYLLHVLRTKIGDTVRLFNAKDGEWAATVTTVTKKSLTLTPQKQTRLAETQTDLWLCCAPVKKAHFEYIIEKGTELGVAVIQPVLTSRTQIREVNLERATAIATEAAEQSDRLSIPEIRKPLTLDQLIATWSKDRALIVCAEWGDAEPIGKALKPATQSAILTGPEGGFAEDELQKLRAVSQANFVRLGPRILRADTAAIAALTCWQAQCGDWQ